MTDSYIDACCRESVRLLTPSGYLMRWVDTFALCEAQHLRIADVCKCVDLIAWDNLRMGNGYRSRRRGDYLLVLQKPPLAAKSTWRDHGIPSRWVEKVDRNEHPHIKPIGLITRLIGAVTKPRDLVVDPAAGSFVVMRAANQLGRDFIGCDKAYSAAGDAARAAGFTVTGCDRVSVGAHTQPMESGHGHLSTANHGTAVDARDAGVAAFGCHVDTLRRALTRNSDGPASGQPDLFAEGT
jgi:site-specific DNA-methyltransferase (adenine-specific)